MTALLKSRYLNRWWLFWIVVIPISIRTLLEMRAVDVSSGAGVSHMIGYSVRFAVPLIYLVIAASAMQRLFPGPLTHWWLRNRKYIGLMFAVAMGWQGAFILTMSLLHSGYYYEEIYLLRDELEGSVGYIFLAAMVLTSFAFGRKHLSKAQWDLLHTSGVYFLWAYPFSVYWWNLSYYGNPQTIDYVFYWTGFFAFAVRIAAWGKQRVRAKTTAEATPLAIQLLGYGVIAFGLVAAATGYLWQAPVTEFLTGPAWSARLVLWLPFWPFEPFLPLFLLGIGTMLVTGKKASSKSIASAIPNS